MGLYPHQKIGAAWLAEHPRGALLDEQGLGKTCTAIVAADLVRARRVLVLVPSVVLWNWRKEIDEWSPWRRVQLLATGKARIDAQADVVVTTHGLILRPAMRAQLLAASWDLLIVDEAHNFRSPNAKRTRILYGVHGRPEVPSIVSRCARVWPMTGTPAPNNASELWSMLWGLFPNAAPWSFTAFRSRFCVTRPTKYGDGVKVVGNRNAVELRALLAGRTLRRLKSDHLDLPPVRHETIALRPDRLPTDLSSIEASLAPLVRDRVRGARTPAAGWDVLRDLMLGKVKDDEGHALTREQFATWRRLSGLAKIEPVVELLTAELEHGGLGKVVVFAHHADVVHGIRSGLHGFGAVAITGATPAAQRARIVESFQKDARVRVIVCNIVAGGTGTTLTAAADTVFAELSWVPGENAQAADRVHRIGQTARSVRIRFVALAGTIDEQVVAGLAQKLAMIRAVLS